MSNDTQKGFETLGEAARRLLQELDERRGKKASERLTTSSEQIGRDDLDRLFSGTGNAPAVPQIAADADERDPAQDRATSATLSGFETASRMVRVRPLPEVVYVTWVGQRVVAANGNHARSLCFEG